MDYIDRLNHIAGLDDYEALEVILSEATNTSQEETIVKLYSAALIDAATRFGEEAMADVIKTIDIHQSTAYERQGIVRFYGGFSACAEFVNQHPMLRYSHFKDAMRFGKHYARKYHNNDESRARTIALNVMRWASSEGKRTNPFRHFVQEKTAPNKPNRVGNYTGLIVSIDKHTATIQITSGDMKTLRDYSEDVLRLNISVGSE